MTKLIYPQDGLSTSQANNMENAKSNLEKATQMNLDIPSTFTNKNYLNTLISDVYSCLEEHKRFQELLEKNDNNYQNVGNEVANYFNIKNNAKISKREKIL